VEGLPTPALIAVVGKIFVARMGHTPLSGQHSLDHAKNLYCMDIANFPFHGFLLSFLEALLEAKRCVSGI